MKKVNFLILSLILCFSCIVVGCNKKTNVSESTEDSALLAVTPNPSQLNLAGTNSTFSTWIDEEPTETSTDLTDSTPTETVDPLMTDDVSCVGNDTSYLNNDPGTPPTANTMSQNDLTNETYESGNGYVTYPLAHKNYSKIGKYTWDELFALDTVYVSVNSISVDTKGQIIITGVYMPEEDVEKDITICHAGIRCFESSTLTDPLIAYFVNTLKFDILNLTAEGGGLYVEFAETDAETGIVYGYGWLADPAGEQFYQLQEYLLAYGYVEPYATNNTIKYWDYYTQYPELFKSW